MLPTGMIDAGVGETHFNNILSTMNIPGMHHKTLKRHERSIGSVVESAAKKSCDISLMMERDATLRKSDPNIPGRYNLVLIGLIFHCSLSTDTVTHLSFTLKAS